ncbi:hypothetical protein CFC21_093097 [Triticum aestivum]|uniref:Sulfotransferase n=4 Tax=Triticinae TaxID=1648030 RepID=A0A453P8D3_AEGTS|nr:cytosolic sulfotransferase 5 [Aegilops tauschii subsp. strangulata]XP_044416643.1 cytosolic sulfotransferase 5-like [Triticum aestivum]KAF7090333.1 hypothetical protein CFC21_093097 [Triticum aestivum]
MATVFPRDAGVSTPEADEAKKIYDEARRVVSTYETVPSPSGTLQDYCRHPSGWCITLPIMVSSMVAEQHFEARGTDVLLVTMPKSGTTWIKALLYAAAHRTDDTSSSILRQLASHNSHQLVPFLEAQVYTKDQIPDLSSLPAPRLFATHIPAESLPPSVVASGCKVVYLCRDPKDCFVSLWHFMNKFTPWDIDEAHGRFCEGVSLYGPFWEHVLSYWRWHVDRPGQVLFLTYEELSADPLGQLRRLAEFIGRPFTPGEQEAGVDREIAEACAMKSMVNQEVNQSRTTEIVEMPIPNGIFFRRGVVGDWTNYLTPEMAGRIDEITKSKFEGSGLMLPKTISEISKI